MELLQIPPKLLSRISTALAPTSWTFCQRRRHLASGQRRGATFKAESEVPAASCAAVFVYLINDTDVGVAKTLACMIPIYENEKNATWTPRVQHSLSLQILIHSQHLHQIVTDDK